MDVRITNNQYGTDIETTDTVARTALGEAITGVSINAGGTFIHFVEEPTPEQLSQLATLIGDEMLIVQEETEETEEEASEE